MVVDPGVEDALSGKTIVCVGRGRILFIYFGFGFNYCLNTIKIKFMIPLFHSRASVGTPFECVNSPSGTKLCKWLLLFLWKEKVCFGSRMWYACFYSLHPLWCQTLMHKLHKCNLLRILYVSQKACKECK